ncbi:MAG: hypothetical protein JSS24_15645, partial [Proteobacteria bacterium]|nr:hypothetical protein [Pseudomonadota bacterium]
YRCEANGRLVEVSHKLSEKLHTWGELCERAGVAPGRTNPRAPVQKLISASFIGSGASAPVCGNGSCDSGACEPPACGTGGCGANPCGGW